jgi:hypothetical protein
MNMDGQNRQEVAAYKITQFLTDELTKYNDYGAEGSDLNGTVLPESVTRRQVVQGRDGRWRENHITETDPIKNPLKIISDYQKNSDQVVQDYTDYAAVYDTDMYNYNVQINQKKQLILDTVSAAVAYGCSTTGLLFKASLNFGDPDPEPQPFSINKVVVGYGQAIRYGVGIDSTTSTATIYQDAISVNVYHNLKNYDDNANPFQSTTYTLTPSNFGAGKESIVNDNAGSSVGNYVVVDDPTVPACVNYANTILSLALEIGELRRLRNKQLDACNIIKKDKTLEEVKQRGRNRTNIEIEKRKTTLSNAISNVSSFVDDIVLDKLFMYFDSTKAYSLTHSVENTTGIDKVTSWVSISKDAVNAIPSTENPTIDLADGPSVWFNQYSFTGKYFDKYFDLNKTYINDNTGITDGNVSYTIESWFKVTDDSTLTSNVNTGGASIVGITSTAGIGLQIYKPSGVRLNFGSRGNGSLVNSSNLSLDTWYHVVCSREVGNNNRIYINGSLDNTSNISDLSVTGVVSTTQMRIGFCTSTYIQKYFPGKISVIRMYSKALSDEEVLKNYNAQSARYT